MSSELTKAFHKKEVGIGNFPWKLAIESIA